MTSLKMRGELDKWSCPNIIPQIIQVIDDYVSIETTTVTVTWGSTMAAQWPKLLATASAAARKKLSGMLLAWQHTAPKDMPGKM